MKKISIIFLLNLLFCSVSFAENYYFKECKLSNAVTGNYIINTDKNVIEVELKAVDGNVQYFSDEIKLIEKNKIISKKIKSARGENLYYQYFLDVKSKSVIKLQYKKQSVDNIELFNLMERRKSGCLNIKSDWDKDKLKKLKLTKNKRKY